MSEKKLKDRTDIAGDEIAAMPSHDEIARLAYALWQAHGGCDGSAEQDWLEAERKLRQPKAQSQAA
jgi:hypothetical protein